MNDNALLYIDGGGIIFRVTDIDRLRDGGTTKIETDDASIFYADKTKNTLHSAYPTDEKNKIQDKILLSFLKDRIYTYLERQSEILEMRKRAVDKMKFVIEN